MTDRTGQFHGLRVVLAIIGAVIAVSGITAPLLSHEMTTIAAHHLLHAGMAAGAGLLGLGLARGRADLERSGWLWPAVIAPAIGLLLMWPSEYAWLMGHPFLHMLDHLCIALCALLTVYAAQSYVGGLGWLMLVLLVAMDAACAGGFGVAPGPSFLLEPGKSAVAMANMTPSTGRKTATSRPAATMSAMGSELYQTMGCSGCHSVDGTKGVGPTWKNLAGYPQKLKDGKVAIASYQFLRMMILDPGKIDLAGYPQGVMPASYRTALAGPRHPHETRLNAIIWYINTLSNRAGKVSEPPVPDEIKP